EEMKIELAWLGDPGTFPYHLSAHSDGPAIQVRGFVPNEAVREHALKVARASTTLPVNDGLKLHRNLAMRTGGDTAEHVQKAAVEVLAEGFPEIAQGIEVKVRPGGHVMLNGTARSFEEKLAISQRLRRLNGCMSVVNHLKVAPVVREGSSYTMV